MDVDQMTVEYALEYKVGSLVHRRHNDVQRRNLTPYASKLSLLVPTCAVDWEPYTYIYSVNPRPVDEDAAAANAETVSNNNMQLLGRLI